MQPALDPKAARPGGLRNRLRAPRGREANDPSADDDADHARAGAAERAAEPREKKSDVGGLK